MEDDITRKDAGEYLRRLIELDKDSFPRDGGDQFNRLIFASSPYLLQHAENPVDWYEWGEEAFAEAARTDRPLLLSIGYATCHWCHVMAHESFEDREVAEVLNRNFVAIKVDREERPDIDDTYMTVSRLMTGSGGWPLNVFLTPDGKPFLTITYLPRTRRGGVPGFVELLENVATLWRTQRDKVERNCSEVMAELKRVSQTTPGDTEKEVGDVPYRQLEGMYDGEWAGFGNAPKFPMPVYLDYLLRFWQKSGNASALGMTTQTLRMMRRGGIFDQLGFGFHRYSVDREWLVPHFEKMLYDQALLASSYLQAFQATGDELFATVAEEIFTFVLRELASPEGAFYSALDADSEGEEGLFYVWTPAQIKAVLGEQEGNAFCRCYGVTEQGNFEGANILHIPKPSRPAGDEHAPPRAADLEQAREKLLAAREKRIRPLRDEKVLTVWNGLMISALARGYMATGKAEYRTAAERGVAFLLNHLQNDQGRLQRSYHHGPSGVPAFLEDYACFCAGLIDLYQATLERAHLDQALRLTREMLRLFGDDQGGGLFDTGFDAETVLVRKKSADDGVTPSGNSVAAMNLVRLGRIADDAELLQAGERLIQAFTGNIGRQPAAYLYFLAAVEFFTSPVVEVVLAGEPDAPETAALLQAVGRRFIPNLVLRGNRPDEGGGTPVGGQATAYVCAAGACRPPVAGPTQLGGLLDEICRHKEHQQ